MVEDGTLTATGKVSVSDVDGDSLTYSSSGTSTYGAFVINASTGEWTYTLDNDAAQSLAKDQEVEETFTVTVADGNGGTATQDVVITITGTNDGPTNITLSASTVAENVAAGTLIATLSATDVDAGDTFTYALVAGEGGNDADNGLVEIVGNQLKVKSGALIDFETKPVLQLNVKVTDAGGLSYTKALTIDVSDVNEAPTNITLSANTITENVTVGTGMKIGDLAVQDPDASGNNNVLTVEGTDRTLFQIRNGSELFFTGATSPNYEAKPSYSITVKSTDGALTYSKAFTINVIDVNEFAPVFTSGLVGSVDENAPTSTVIYRATTTDQDGTPEMRTVVYSLMAGGDSDLLNIDGATGEVTLKDSANFEAKRSYNFTVEANNLGLVTKHGVIVSVIDVNEFAPQFTNVPTGLTVDENAPVTTVIYQATATDGDGSAQLRYRLDGADKDLLTISSTGAVRLRASADFETQPSYSFTVVVTDGEKSATQDVTVNVNDLVEELNRPRINTVAGDDIINASETATTLTGTAVANATVRLTLGANVREFMASESGEWSYTLTAADMAALGQGEQIISATATLGEATSAADTRIILVDTIAPNPAKITVIGEAGGLNKAEATNAVAVTVEPAVGATIVSAQIGSTDLTPAGSTGFTRNYTFDASNLAQGRHTLSVRSRDAAGNETVTNHDITIDTLEPKVNFVALTSASVYQNSALITGSIVTATVEFDQVVTVTGTPRLTLMIGTTEVQAVYSGGSGSNKLTFNYTILANQTDADGIAIPADALLLNGGTIRDAAGNNASLGNNAVADNASYKVDTTQPAAATIVVAGEANGLNAQEATSAVAVTITPFSGTVTAATINGTPLTSTGSNGYTFDAAALASGTYSINVTTSTGATTSKAITLDKEGPTITSVALASANGQENAVLNVGNIVLANVTFSEAVTVANLGGSANSMPTIDLQIGTQTVKAWYIAGAGTNTLTFQYQIGAGQMDANGIAIPLVSIDHKNASFRDAAGNDATLSSTVSASDNPAFKVDTTLPPLTSLLVAENTAVGTVIHTQTKAGVTYSLQGADAELFTFNRGNGQLSLKQLFDFENPIDTGADNVYNITLAGSDASSVALTIKVTDVVNETVAGQAVINLGAGNGQLINGIQVEGKWYYYWDRNGSGGADLGDRVNHNALDQIFTQDINGNTNPAGAGADTTNQFRYAELNGVKLALPTQGIGTYVEGQPFGTWYYFPGTAITIDSQGGFQENPLYDDLAAIWDVYSGTTTNHTSNVDGTPSGWARNLNYWSATSTGSGTHGHVVLLNGDVNSLGDTSNGYVALQVL